MADQQEKDQKTEDATPRRKDEARENGQVAMSQEMIAAMMLIAGLGCLMFGGRYLSESAGGLLVDTLRTLGPLARGDFTPGDAAALLEDAARQLLIPLAIVFTPPAVIGVMVGYGQVGFRITPKAVAMDPSKIDPIKGMKKLLGARAWVRTGLSALKILTIAGVMIAVATTQVQGVIRLGSSELGPLMVGLGHVALRCILGALAAILVLALADMAYQRYQHEKDLRMTKQEVKEENRITEGDPHLKARVRQVQREFATSRMMADVPKATVVVTNPTHYAVALSYQRDGGGGAPRCLAKGIDHVAQRIKAVAREHEVVLYEDVPLARALHAQVEVGQEIPEELFTAVAEVLAYVYRLEGSAVGAA